MQWDYTLLSQVAAIARSNGWEAGPGVKGKIMGELRRGFRVAVVRGQALCLLERLAHLGPGARAAAQRSQVTIRVEESRRRAAGLLPSQPG